MSKPLMLLKNTKVILLLSIVIVGGIGGFFTYQWTASNEVKSNISETSIEITWMQLLSINQSAMDVLVNLTIDNPSSHTANIEGKSLNVSILADSENEIYIGTMNLQKLRVGKGMNHISANYTIILANQNAFDELVNAFLSEEEIGIKISGYLKVSVTDLLIPVESTVFVEKTITVPALNDLNDLSISSLELIDVTNDSLTFQLNISVYNPSYLRVDIASMNWSAFYNGILVGRVSAYNVQLTHGTNRFTAIGSLEVNETLTVQELVSKYISGENITVILNGKIAIGMTGVSDYYISNIQLPVKLSGQPNIQVSINELSFYEFTENEINAHVAVNITNPSRITGTLRALLLDVLYEEQLLGIVNVSDIPLTQGSNIVHVNVTFTPENTEILTDLASQYLSGHPVVIKLRGSSTGNTLSTLLSGWSQEIELRSNQGLEFRVLSIGLLNSTSDSLFLHFDLQIVNPTDARIEIDNFLLNVTLSNTSDYLGNITIEKLELEPGLNNISIETEFYPSNTSLVADIVDDYLSGNELNFVLTNINTNDTLMGRILSGIKFNVTLPGVNPLDIVIISISILDITSENVTMAVNVSITNPTASTVHMETIYFQTYYKGEFLGNVSVGPLDVDPGTHLYTVNVTFTPANQTLLKLLATDYVNGIPVNLTLQGCPTGDDVLSKVVQRYLASILVPPLDLNFQVANFSLINSTETTLVIGMNVTITNPLQTAIDVWNVTLEVYYNDMYIGNCTIDSLSLVPGTVTYEVNGTLDASANRTNINQFLSEYIAGVDILLDVRGTIMTNLSGLIEDSVIPVSFRYTLVGIKKTLITDVNLYSLTIDLGTMTIVATTIANITNPMGFNISITYLEYDIYFDDTDGADVQVGFVIVSYPPKSNILIDSIEKDLSSNPIELSANSNTTISEDINIQDEELAVRLYDEYYIDNNLKINILNGIMTIKIGVFEAQVHFEFYNVPVS
ncbi:MAG: DUF3712 domain-containing protein [Candidatus Korarchaeota archaeon]|nr:DUF3712 domain-containing protein [Candidatus Korarchaeota archaeon]